MNKKVEKIINTTIKLFIRDGIRKITMDDIAENAKVSKVTIYKYFVDKDTLFFEISKFIFSNYIERIEGLTESGEELIKKLYVFIDIISEFTDGGQFELCRGLARYNDAIEALYEKYLRTYRNSILMLIEEGIQSGIIKSGLSKDMIFYYFDMGVVYYQKNTEYRNRMNDDISFQKRYMLFYISNIFVDGTQVLPAL